MIGSDIPGISAARIAQAFACLGQADAVLGPAPDGGFWVIGLRHPQRQPRGFLKDVRWSGPDAMTDSIQSLAPLRYKLTTTLQDIDTGSDLAAYRNARLTS